VACAGLVNFLTVALVQPTEEQDAPFTVHPQAVNPGYLPGPVAINYRREHILYRDLPSLWLATTRPVANDPALVDVVRGMRGMVTEARVERKDRSQNREESRHPKIVRGRWVIPSRIAFFSFAEPPVMKS
jgi:hypothetical protein